MSTLTMPVPARAAETTSQDHGIALLTARAGLEPDLAARYLADPVSVLAEFGVVAAEPVYLTGGGRETLVIEDLDGADIDVTYGCGPGGCWQDAPLAYAISAA
jgi:hypothetical protein